MTPLPLLMFDGWIKAWHFICGRESFDRRRWADGVLRDQETASIIVEVDVAAGVTPTDRMKEDCPAVWLSFNLDVGLAQIVAIMCSQNNANPVRWMNENGEIGWAKFRHATRFHFSGEEVGVVGGDREPVFVHENLHFRETVATI